MALVQSGKNLVHNLQYGLRKQVSEIFIVSLGSNSGKDFNSNKLLNLTGFVVKYRENQSTLLPNVNWQKSDWNATIDNLSWLFYVERVTMKIRLSTKVRWSKTNYFDKKTKLAKGNVELHAWLIYLFLSLVKRRDQATRTIMDVCQASNGHQS